MSASGFSLADLVIKFTGDVGELKTSVDDIQKMMSKSSAVTATAMKDIQGSLGLAGTALKGLAAAFTVDAALSWAKDVTHAASSLQDLSSITGSSVEDLSALSNQVKIAGGDFGDFETLLAKFTANMVTGDEESTKLGYALGQLGVTAKDPAEAMKQVVIQLDKYKNGVDKTALAKDLFGPKAVKFIAVLHDMAEQLDVTGTITTKEAEESQRLEQQLTKLGVQATWLKTAFLDNVVPALNEVIAKFIEGRKQGQSFWEALASGSRSAVEDQKYIDGMISKIGDLRAKLEKGVPHGYAREMIEAQIKTTEDELHGVQAIRDKYNADKDTGTIVAPPQKDLKYTPFSQLAKDKADALQKMFEGLESAAEKAVTDANIQWDNLFSSDKPSKALEEFTKLTQSKDWAKLSEDQQNALARLYAGANRTMVAATELDKTFKEAGEAAKKAIDERKAYEDQVAASLDASAQAYKDQLSSIEQQNIVLNASADSRAHLVTLLKFEHDNMQLAKDDAAEYARRLGVLNDALIDLEQHVNDDWMKKQIEDMQFELSTMTMSNSEREIAIKLREAEQRGIEKGTQDWEDYNAALRNNAAQKESIQGQIDLWRKIDQTAEEAFVNIFNTGANIFQRLRDVLKNTLLQLLYQMTIKKWIFNIGAAVSSAGGAAGVTAEGLAGQSLTSGIGNAIFGGVGNAISTGYTAGSLGFSGGTAASVFAEGAALPGAATGIGSGIISGIESGLAAIGPVGWAAAAALIVGGIVMGLDKGPAQRSASFGSGSGLGAGNPLFQSQSAFGKFGIFNDKWFSDQDQGAAVQQFLANIKTVDDAIAGAVGPDVTSRISAALAAATTEFEAGIEHQATSFGDVFQQRYSVVAHAISDELGGLVDNFKGTGDALAKFVTGIVGVYETIQRVDVTKIFGQAVSVTDFANLTDAGGDVAATFQNLVDVFNLTNAVATALGHDASDAFGEVGLASKDLREHFIELLGGMQAAGAAVTTYLNSAFTDTERKTMNAASGMTTLNDVFGRLGIAVPKDWASLNQLIASYSLGDETQQAVAATLISEVVPAFAAVNGTAQEAADAVQRQADANRELASSLHETALSFLSTAGRVTEDWRSLNNFWTSHGADLFRITGFDHIPTAGPDAVSFYERLAQAVNDGVPGAAELATLVRNQVIPATSDLNSGLAELANNAEAAANSIDVGSIIGGGFSLADKILSAVDTAIGVGNASFGDKLAQKVTGIFAQITQLDEQIANAPSYIDTRPLEVADQRLHVAYDEAGAIYARYVGLVATYGQKIGEQLEQLSESFATTKQALAQNPAALALATQNFNTEWQNIIDGTADGVDKTLDQLAKLRQGLLDEVQKLTVGNLSPLSGFEKFTAAQNAFNADVALARTGNLDAFGRLNSEAESLLSVAQSVYGSGNAFTTAFNNVTGTLTELGTPPPEVSTDSSFVDAGSTAVVGSVQENTAATNTQTETIVATSAITAGQLEELTRATIDGYDRMSAVMQQEFRNLVASWQSTVRA